MSAAYDVAIIGGGPAGCAAALVARAGGARVVLCERRSSPVDGPAESLHPGCEVLLDRIGVGPRFRAIDWPRYPGIVVADHDRPFGADHTEPWRGFHIDRARFDGLLLDAVAAAGVEVRRPCAVHGLRLDGGAVVGLDTDGGPLTARWTIDAAGRGQLAARLLDLRMLHASPRLHAWRGRLPGRMPDARARFDPAPPGWIWRAQVGEQIVWTVLGPAGERPTATTLSRWLPVSPDFERRGYDLTWRAVRPVVRPGLLLAGDAATVLDPASGQGVFFALESGARVGALAAGRPHALDLARHDDWVMRSFEHKVGALRAIYADLGLIV